MAKDVMKPTNNQSRSKDCTNNKRGRNSRNSKAGYNKASSAAKSYNSKDRAVDSSAPNDTHGRVVDPVNDYTWRIVNESLGAQAAAFPFTSFIGKADDFKTVGAAVAIGGTNYTSPVAIEQVFINPGVGCVYDQYSAINQQARALYTNLSSVSNKTTAYAPEDIIVTMLALGEVLSLYTVIRRAFGLMRYGNERSYLAPRAVVEAAGFDYDDLSRNYAKYVSRMNNALLTFAPVVFPAELDYFKTCVSLYSDIFLDAPTKLAQLWVPIPYSTWELDEVGTEAGSHLVTVPLGFSTPKKMDSIIDTWIRMVTKLTESSTLQLVYTDVANFLLKHGGTALNLPMIPLDITLEPVFSEEWALMMENAVVVGVPASKQYGNNLAAAANTINNDVFCDAGTATVRYRPAFHRGFGATSDSSLRDITLFMTPVLNFHSDNPSLAERIAAARFVPAVKQVFNGATNPAYSEEGSLFFWANVGDHYVVAMRQYVMNDQTGWTWEQTDSSIETIARSRVLRHGPRFILGTVSAVTAGATPVTISKQCVFASLDTYTLVDRATIDAMADLALQSLFMFHSGNSSASNDSGKKA